MEKWKAASGAVAQPVTTLPAASFASGIQMRARAAAINRLAETTLGMYFSQHKSRSKSSQCLTPGQNTGHLDTENGWECEDVFVERR